MRDPKSIERILTKLARYWNRHPDLRLGQLVDNATNTGLRDGGPSLFYVEDDDFEAKLDEMIWKHSSS